MASKIEDPPERDSSSRLSWPNPPVADHVPAAEPTCGFCGGSTADVGGAEYCSWQCSQGDLLT